MWGCHRSSVKNRNRFVWESRNDSNTRGPHIHTGTEVREVSLSVVDGRSCDGYSLPNTSGRAGGNVFVVVSGSDDDRDTEVEELKTVGRKLA